MEIDAYFKEWAIDPCYHCQYWNGYCDIPKDEICPELEDEINNSSKQTLLV